MSKSSDPGHFFQTSTSLETAARRAAKAGNTNGEPITCTSKLLSLLPDPLSPTRVYVSESGGPVRRIDLESGSISHLYRGHNTPVTCLALSADGKTLFGGCWDKTISAWNVTTRERVRVFDGHADFVKSLLYLRNPAGDDLLLSGSSDSTIIVWNVVTGAQLAKLRGHTRAVGTLAVDPVASTADAAVIYAGGSEREIRVWKIPFADPAQGAEIASPIKEHETSVFKVGFMGEDADFWTASADFTARRIDVRAAEGKIKSDTVLKHKDYVNDVVVEPTGRWVCTACRDEGVRVWDTAEGTLYHTFEGHVDEVAALAVVGERGDVLVSASIDCTVRRWSLKPADLKKAVEETKNGVEKKAEKKEESLMTAEEEAELAELMEDSD